MMHMSFWWGDDLGDFFIKGFTINTSSSMFLLCLGLFVLSILVESLKVKSSSLLAFPSYWSCQCFDCFRSTKRNRAQKQRVRKADRCRVRPVKMQRFYQRKPQVPCSKCQFWVKLSTLLRKFHFSSSTMFSTTDWCLLSWCSTVTSLLLLLQAHLSVISSSDTCQWRQTWKTSKQFKRKSFAHHAVLIPVCEKAFFFSVSWFRLLEVLKIPLPSSLFCRSFMCW